MVPLHMLPDALRAEDVKRWHMVRTIRPQNLAEHSFGVALIAGVIARELDWPEKDVHGVSFYALCHDLDEVFTGDIPSHTKQALKDLGADWRKMEGKFDSGPSRYYSLIKAADYIEAIRFGNENCHGEHAKKVLAEIFNKFEEFSKTLEDDQERVVMEVYSSVMGRKAYGQI